VDAGRARRLASPQPAWPALRQGPCTTSASAASTLAASASAASASPPAVRLCRLPPPRWPSPEMVPRAQARALPGVTLLLLARPARPRATLAQCTRQQQQAALRRPAYKRAHHNAQRAAAARARAAGKRHRAREPPRNSPLDSFARRAAEFETHVDNAQPCGGPRPRRRKRHRAREPPLNSRAWASHHSTAVPPLKRLRTVIVCLLTTKTRRSLFALSRGQDPPRSRATAQQPCLEKRATTQHRCLPS
jgi:hypothetical protein